LRVPEALSATTEPWLAARARRDPDAPALMTTSARLTWQQLAERVELTAARLVRLDVGPGMRVAVVMEPSLRFVELVHAMQYLGATLVLVNTRLAAAERDVVLAHADPALVLHDRAQAVATGPRVRTVDADGELDAVTAASARIAAPLDLATVQTILYTSGTTGLPKGVMLTHANHAASAAASRAHLGARVHDRWLCALPLYHVGGLSILLRSVLDGAPVVLHERFDPAAIWDALHTERVTLLSLVPTMLHRLLEHAEAHPGATALRAVLVGGAALAPSLAARARAEGLPILPTYGLTETASQVATAAPGEPADDAVGRALGATRLRIEGADRAGHGEIVVAGPSVMAGYFRDPEATASVLRDGWLHTGDVGRLDDDGRLHVFDRRTDVVITGGENVYPAEVEAVLLAHPAVAEAGVYGVPDAEWGRRVHAAVVLRDGTDLTAAELRRWCRTRLAGYKVPRAIVRMPALPRTASGKLRRHLLADGESVGTVTLRSDEVGRPVPFAPVTMRRYSRE
jgi:O-succinylbenzoic acid--CoA ligase